LSKKIVKTEKINPIVTSNDLLLEAQWPQLTINEQRLVVYMLSLIKRDDTDFQTYRISVRELANIMEGSRKDLYQRFDEATEGLMKKVIRWNNPDEKSDGRIDKTTWCSSASVIPGKGCVELRFDPTLKPFLLALKGNFTSWGEARAVIRLKNHYSLRIYQFIKYNQGMSNVDGRKSATVEVDWLRQYLAIPDDTYKLFGHFKSKVLISAQKDIAAKSDIEFDFEHIIKGRKVCELKFTWWKNKRFDQMELPGVSGEGKSTMEDILIYEFGIAPEKMARDLVQEYGSEHIKQALQMAREYIAKLKKRGKTVENVGGVARKAIEEGWKPQSLEIAALSVQEKPVFEKRQIEKKRAEEEELENELSNQAFGKYKALSDLDRATLLAGFRDYLLEAGHKIIVERYDEGGLTPGPVESIFKEYVKKRLI